MKKGTPIGWRLSSDKVVYFPSIKWAIAYLVVLLALSGVLYMAVGHDAKQNFIASEINTNIGYSGVE